MRKACRSLLLTFVFFLSAIPIASAVSGIPEERPVLVGRISQVEGQLLRYVPNEKDWVAAVKDTPFGLDDALYADDDAKAELINPNGSWVRIGGNTQIQLIALKQDVTEIDVASGMARFYNKSRDAVLKATTPFGYVVAPAATEFDLYVGDNSVEVIVLKGTLDFVHDGDETRYEIVAGSSSIVADNRDVTKGSGTLDAGWDDWNTERDRVWEKKLEVKGDSVRFLPSQLHDESSVLEENGRWERVYYQGSYRRLWRPSKVGEGWTPFSVGRWTEWNGDHCWVPDEPFGYVTHHYGNWIHVGPGNSWYWAPPEVLVGVGVRPVLGIGFGWYPGRVAWIHSGATVGWVPLAPFEPYYSNRYWGPRSIIVSPGININIGSYAYLNHAVLVDQSNLYRVNNYNHVRITNINSKTILNNYRAAPVVNSTVVNNISQNKQRYDFRNVNVKNKPHQSVLRRIEHNENMARRTGDLSSMTVRKTMENARPGNLSVGGSVAAPRVTGRMVPAGDINRPKSDIKFPERVLKEHPKPVRPYPESLKRGQEGQSANRSVKPGTSRRGGREVSPARRNRGMRSGDPGQRTQPRGRDYGIRRGDAARTGQPRDRRERIKSHGKPSRPGENGRLGRPELGRNKRPSGQSRQRRLDRPSQKNPQMQGRPKQQRQEKRRQMQEQRRQMEQRRMQQPMGASPQAGQKHQRGRQPETLNPKGKPGLSD